MKEMKKNNTNKKAIERAGFILDENKNIKVHVTEDVEYVTFYKNDRLIPIPYDCLVCFVAGNVNDPKPVPESVKNLEKLIIDIQNLD